MSAGGDAASASRSAVFGRNGMVATSQQAATQAGLEILKLGGNALDAAIAANAMLSLTEPHMCGPGGDLFAIVWDPGERRLFGLNASGRSPGALAFDSLRDQLGNAETMPDYGPLAVTVPGAVDGWCTLHDRFGRMAFAELFAPAVKSAREGVSVGERTAAWWGVAARALLSEPGLEGRTEGLRRTFCAGGRPPRAADTFRNPALARSLERIAEGGREAFYRGSLGRGVVDCVSEAGGWLEEADLLAHRSEWVEPLGTSYRGYDVFELPPNASGAVVLQMLNVLELHPVGSYGRFSADYWHTFLEAKKLAFEDRARYYAEPDGNDLPVQALVAKEYARSRADLIDPAKAGTDYAHGDVDIRGSDTTYLATADRDGMMVSLIQSIFQPFGSGLVPAELGFALHGRGAGFSLEPGHPNCYGPGKRPFHTILPAFAMRDGEPWMSFGVMGADMQPQGQVQILANLIDFGMSPQAAGDAPRMRHFGGRSPNGSGSPGAGSVHYEPGFPEALISELEGRGHRLEAVSDWIDSFVGGYQSVVRGQASPDVYTGASESRFDGCALGF